MCYEYFEGTGAGRMRIAGILLSDKKEIILDEMKGKPIKHNDRIIGKVLSLNLNGNKLIYEGIINDATIKEKILNGVSFKLTIEGGIRKKNFKLWQKLEQSGRDFPKCNYDKTGVHTSDCIHEFW